MQPGENTVQRGGSSERRQVTVLFCDMVDSTRIAEVVDAEDLQQLYLAYRATCDACVAEFGGHIDSYYGDGILASFGYPVAVEKSTQRAINAGLRLIDVVRSKDWSRYSKLPVHVRVGIHTGIVVAGDPLGDPEGRSLLNLVGAAPNIASRLQNLAAPDSIVISEEARLLVDTDFVTSSLGEHQLKGVSRPTLVHRVLHASPNVEQATRWRRASLAPMVGRSRQLSTLLECWAHAEAGHGAAVCVSGDAGIGKSRLIAEFCALTQTGRSDRTLEFQCSPYYRNSSLYPVIETLERWLGTTPSSSPDERVAALEARARALSNAAEALPLFASLLSIPNDGRFASETLSPEAARKRTIECIVEWILSRSAEGPAFVVFSDIHWVDPTTLDVISELVSRIRDRPVLAVLTYRTDAPARVRDRFGNEQHIDLVPLSHEDMEQLVYHVAGAKHLPKEIVRQILDNTAGVPLFGEELTKAVIHSSAVVDQGTHYQANQWQQLDVPAALQDILAVRLERTGSGRRVAQIASVLGRRFNREILAFLCQDIPDLDRQLEGLCREGILQQDSAEPDVFTFRHALIQKAAYESLLKTTRGSYHQRVANVLATHPDRTNAYPPELVAQHFTLGGLADKAIPIWLEAAGRSLRRSANLEACAQAEGGLSCIRELGSPPPLRPAELMLQTMKGTALIATRGWGVPDVGEAFERAAEISMTLSGAQHTSALWGLWAYRFMRGELAIAREYAEQMLRIGEETGDSSIAIEGHWTLGATLYWLPDLAGSRKHLEAAVRMYDRETHSQNAFVYGQDPGVSARAWLMFVLAHSGHTSDAIRCGKEALELAKAVDHPFSTAWALAANALLRIEVNDVEGVLTLGNEALRYCMDQEQAFWVANLMMAVGWAKTRSGQASEGVAMAERGYAAYEATGVRLILSFFAAMLTDCHLAAGDVEGAQKWLARGVEIAEAQKEAPIVPSLLLIKAALAMRSATPDPMAAIVALREAMAKASEQGLRIRELQAASALAQLLLATGDRDGARAVLEPIVTWFQEHGDPSAASAAAPLLAMCR
jgi:class 3 adenylate cyclase/tetratricopeptide (TPR) repeat protein